MLTTHRVVAAQLLVQEVCSEHRAKVLVKIGVFVCVFACVGSLTMLLLSLHKPDFALLFTKKCLLLDVQTLRISGRVRVHVTDLLTRCCV